MAKRNRDLEAWDRQEKVRKQVIRIAAAGAAAVLVLLVIFFVRRARRRADIRREEAAESAAAASSAAALAESEEELAFRQSLADAGFEYVDLPEDEGYTEKVTILGTGDNLIHEALYEDARTEDGFDFSPMYELVKGDISAADIATVNMETPLAESVAPISGYPKFNSPDEAGSALIETGFDVINQGNNHILDQGTEGLFATLDFWDSLNVPYVGAYRSTEDLYTRRIIEVNGVKVAFLGFLTSVNGDAEAASGAQLVTFYDKTMIEDLIKDAKANADVVVVHAHWGVEYKDALTDTMREMSQNMVDWGADIIFGNHTHILQRLDVLTRSSDGALCPVLYSCGNFLSGQKDRQCLLSGLLTVTVAKNPSTGDTEVQDLSFEPTVTHYEGDRENVKIYPLAEYTEELAESNGVRNYDEELSLSYLDDLVREHISPQFLKEYEEGTRTSGSSGQMVNLLGTDSSSSSEPDSAASDTDSGNTENSEHAA